MLELIRAEKTDFERLRAFYQSVIDNTGTMSVYARWIYGLHPDDELLQRYIGDGVLYYTESEGEILSAAALEPLQGEDYHGTGWGEDLSDGEVLTVHILCVAPAHQKQGIARQTMEAAVRLGKKQGKKAVRLDALQSNLPAQRLYEGMGFVRRDTKHWYACNVGWTDFILYEKILEN